MPTIHEAAEGADGKVFRGAGLTQVQAVARRRLGLDIVVCSDDTAENCRLARAIEDQVGANLHHGPHTSTAGPQALPHWQQSNPPPEGHAFYETHVRKSFVQP